MFWKIIIFLQLLLFQAQAGLIVSKPKKSSVDDWVNLNEAPLHVFPETKNHHRLSNIIHLLNNKSANTLDLLHSHTIEEVDIDNLRFGIELPHIFKNETYSPRYVQCPATKESFIRKGDELSNEEKNWLKEKNKLTQKYLLDYFKYSTHLSPSEYEPLIDANDSIKIAQTFSGGGVRALLCGAGELSALDNRTKGAFQYGLGGLLQATTYLVGLSGGNWLVGSLVVNDWLPVEKIRDDRRFWDFTNSLYETGSKKDKIISTYRSWRRWVVDMAFKKALGFKVTIVDLWGRALCDKLLPIGTTSYTGTWSGIKKLSNFQNFEMPLPISVSGAKFNHYHITIANSTVIESNPWEIGSWDKHANVFSDIEYLGTKLNNGKPVNNKKCVKHYDTASFIMAVSSNIFDMGVEMFSETIQKYKFLKFVFNKRLKNILRKHLDDGIIKPNPFWGNYYSKDLKLVYEEQLSIVDGGQDWQNIPLQPVMIPQRGVDVVFAFDNSADTGQLWPNGSSLQYTYNRQFLPSGEGYSFPHVPSTDIFIKKGFDKKPTFFGCDAKNMSDFSSIPPLVIYIPNSPYSYHSNFTTLKMTYSDKQRNEIIRNGFEVASLGNGTYDLLYRDCIGCAIIRRKQEKLGIEQSEACQQCFSRYCWDGSY